jgi:hypothetical protein
MVNSKLLSFNSIQWGSTRDILRSFLPLWFGRQQHYAFLTLSFDIINLFLAQALVHSQVPNLGVFLKFKDYL